MPHDYSADVCGIVLYTLFFGLVCIRTRPFLTDRRSLSSTDRIKLAFHVCINTSALLEIVHYAIELAFRGSVLSGYACHLVGLWLSLVSFSLVIVLWSNTLHPPAAARQQQRNAQGGTAANGGGSDDEPAGWRCCGKTRISIAAKFVCAIDAIVALATVVVLWTGSVPAYSRPYLILMVTHSVTLFLLASWLVLYGIRLQRRVMGHPRWEPLDRRQRLKILCRINGVLVVCAACFLVRVAVLSSALFVRSRHRAEDMNRLLFEVLARWVSGLIPGVALLHIMCKTNKPGEDRPPPDQMRLSVVNEDQPLNEPLLPTHHGGGGYVSMAKKKPNGSVGRGTSSNSRSGERVGRRGGAGGADGGQAAGNEEGNDSFAYQIVRSQRERTETTI
ncbi:unnamed protein product [Ectocarpus sp. 8 AP-2014]